MEFLKPFHFYCRLKQHLTILYYFEKMTLMTLASKEEIENFLKQRFGIPDVLKNPRDRIKRKANLVKAATLESINGTEVVLMVEDQNSCKKVRSRIIATADDQVVLTNGISLPIHCIHSVLFP